MGKLGQFLRLNPELMVICLPNNPTGKVYSDKVLREIVSMAEKAGTCVLLDDTYASGCSAGLLQVAGSNFVCVNTLPTDLGNSGCGTGYAVSDEDTIEKMEDIMQLSGIDVPEFTLETVLEAMRVESNVYREYEKEMKRRVSLASEELDRLPVRYYRPDIGTLLFPKVELKAFDSEIFACRLLEEEHVAVTPGQAFGDYPEHFRISLDTKMEEVRGGIAGIGRMLETWERK
jgi:aminotransferase